MQNYLIRVDFIIILKDMPRLVFFVLISNHCIVFYIIKIFRF